MERGIALLQVLIITTVLSLLALYFTQSARQQIALAQAFDEQSSALVKNYDIESRILYALLTESKSPTQKSTSGTDRISNLWNFHSAPFYIDQVSKVRLQDTAGLLNIHYPQEELWLTMLTHLDLKDYDARLLINTLRDWQDLDTESRYSLRESEFKNGVIQSWGELYFLTKEPHLIDFLKSNSTMYRGSTFNPMNSPDELIEALFNDAVSQQVIAARQAGILTPKLFSAYTGVTENRKTILFPSNNYKMTITTVIGQARVHRTLQYLLKPRGAAPVNQVAFEG